MKSLKIIRMAAENVKRIVAFDISPDPDECLVQITGRNGQGKTSVLDCILYALGGLDTIPSQPIRRGQGYGEIMLDLGEFTVRRTLSMAEGPGLEIRSKAGTPMTKTPQGFLNSIMDRISFDPLAFTRQTAKEQAETLKSKVHLELDLDALDAANKADYDERRKLNTQVKEMDGELLAYKPIGGLPAEPLDLDALDTALEEAGQHNVRIEAQLAQKKQYERSADQAEKDVETIALQIADLKSRLALLEQERTDRAGQARDLRSKADALTIEQPVDTSALREQMKEARATNRAIEDRERAAELRARRDRVYAQAVELTERMAARDQEKREAILSAEMPVEGLSFESGEVYYQGFPFSQASGAEQLRISMAIAMSGRKQLRVIRIVDGSLLDDQSLELIKELARANNYQVWMEMVDTTGEVGIVMSEGKVESTPETRARDANRKRGAKAAKAEVEA